MKLIALLLLVSLIFAVSGCEGVDGTMNLSPKGSIKSSKSKNPGGTGSIVGAKVSLHAEPSAKAKAVGEFTEGTVVILLRKRVTPDEGTWIEIKRLVDKAWVRGWVKSESIKFEWKEDSVDKLPDY